MRVMAETLGTLKNVQKDSVNKIVSDWIYLSMETKQHHRALTKAESSNQKLHAFQQKAESFSVIKKM